MNAAYAKYLDLLLLWNKRINLTAVRTAEEIREKHFDDSLAVLPHIPAETKTLIDVGTGPGFPGAVIAIERPSIQVTLVESSHKKTAFLEALRREIPLPNVRVRSERIEAVQSAASFVPFDVAVSRATWDLPEWLAIGRTLVRPGGLVIGMEGAETHDLPAGASRHPYALGRSTRAIITFHVEP